MNAQAWTVEDHLTGQPAVSVAMYQRFVEMLAANGPYICTVGKTMIGFKGPRRGFAGAKPTPRGLTGFLDLQRIAEDRRIISVAPYTRRLFVHQFRIADIADLDESFAALIAEAYAVGQGAHMIG